MAKGDTKPKKEIRKPKQDKKDKPVSAYKSRIGK